MAELTIDQAIQQGIEAHKAGQVQEADRLYTAVLKVQPKHPDANHSMGVLAVGVGKVEQALPFLKTALEANPATAQFWLSYIDALIELEQLANANAVLDQARSKGAKGDGFDKLEQRLRELNKKYSPDDTFTETLETNQSSTLDIAIQLRETGEFNQAIDLLKGAINQFPENADMLALLSHCYLLAEQVDAAKLYLDKAKKIDPENVLVGWNIARLTLKEKKPLEALNVARDFGQKFPDDIEGMGVLGGCLRANKETTESLEVLNRAIVLNPNYAEALVNRGLLRLSKENKPEAVADLEKAHRLKPHIKQIWDLVIGLKVETQEYSDAIVLLLNMITIDPNWEKGFALLATCNQKADDNALAVKSFKKVLEVKPGSAAMHVNLGIALTKQGETKTAITNFKKALAIKPDYADAYFNMGNALKNQGKLEEAIQAYNKALAIKPDCADAYNNMGNALKEQGKLEEAIQVYKKALAIKSDYAEAYNNMGNALQDQGKLEEAIQAYNKALAIKSDYADAYNNMGNALQDQGKLEEAIQAYNKALVIKPDNAEAYNNMGNALKEQGKLEEAIEAYNKALAIKPDNAEAVENSQSLVVQLLPIITNYRSDFDTSGAQANSEIALRPKYQIQNAIKAYLEGDFIQADSHINNFKACDRNPLVRLKPKDKVFCNAYSNFIGQLLEATWDEKSDTENKFYHLGESHCLSYAHRNIAIDGSNFEIVPRITFGAKAFHFSRTKDDTFKAITKAHFMSLPKNSKVFLSYGEIDCRPNEGLISAARKRDKPLEELIDQTTEGYVQWFLEQNAGRRHRLYFINVPAPFYDDKLTTDLNSEVARTVALFNTALKKYSQQHGFDTVDVFKFTAGKEGFSNGLFHIDNKHLGAKAIAEIEQQLS